MTRKEAAEFLRVKERTVDAYVRTNRLPRFHLAGSRTPRFRIEDVRSLIRRGRGS